MKIVLFLLIFFLLLFVFCACRLASIEDEKMELAKMGKYKNN